MKLDLKHLAPYLPYALRIQVWHERKNEPLIVVGFSPVMITEMFIDKRLMESNYNKGIAFKPILRPFSDLTKEIEHNAERFVPIERLFELAYPSHKFENYYTKKVPNWVSCSHVNTAAEFYYYHNDFAENSYETVQQLISWHFDVFRLIDKGLAIDVNSLTVNHKP